MTDREKLIDLLKMPIYPHLDADPAEVVADYLLDNGVTFAKDTDAPVKWFSVEDEKPMEFLPVLGHMTDAGDFPSVRECYNVGIGFYFQALNGIRQIDKWTYIPEPEEE